MIIERLTRKEAKEAMDEWISSSFTIPVLGKDYQEIRNDLVSFFGQAVSSQKNNSLGYNLDVCFGSAIYEYLKQKRWFTERIASDDGFWRYLSLKVVPDLVGERWENTNEDHYYSKPSRIWLKTLWWYIHLSLKEQGINATREMLLSDNFSTDTILNLVERTGRYGTNTEVYRAIMSHYSVIEEVSEKDFRKVMKLNTAKAMVVEPVFSQGGISGYVESLFKELSLI